MTRTLQTVAGEYPVLTGDNVTAELSEYFPAEAAQAFICFQPTVRQYAQQAAAACQKAGMTPTLWELPDAEAGKTFQVLAAAHSALATATFTRTDFIIGVGGGAATDIAGFIAATWLRGVKVIHISTTVLGMVDAAVGGKTALNIPEGKNLVGAFHHPHAVFADTAALATLPAADISAGLGEVAKCGFISDPQILQLILQNPQAAMQPGSPAMRELITRAVQVKADVVAADPRESHMREILNYGHTLAHAIESSADYAWRHGEAVAVGCVYAAELAHRLGTLSADDVALHRRVLSALNLPITYSEASFADLLPLLARDKKSRGHTLRFVTLAGIASPIRAENPAREIMEDAFVALAPRANNT